MDTLALTLAAVFVSLLIGIPLGIWAGLSDRFNRLVTPMLDFMQTMPTFVYLAPLTLFFLIGPASAVIATLIYAVPPVIRITAHGIRSVPPNDRRGGRVARARPVGRPSSRSCCRCPAARSSSASTRRSWRRCRW